MSFQLYRNDETGKRCLEKWRRQCIEWCYDFYENGKYADQKYLDAWPEEFGAISLNAASGAGVAPWNCFKYQFIFTNKPKINGTDLISYHYQGTKMLKYGKESGYLTFPQNFWTSLSADITLNSPKAEIF